MHGLRFACRMRTEVQPYRPNYQVKSGPRGRYKAAALVPGAAGTERQTLVDTIQAYFHTGTHRMRRACCGGREPVPDLGAARAGCRGGWFSGPVGYVPRSFVAAAAPGLGPAAGRVPGRCPAAPARAVGGHRNLPPAG